MRPDSKHTKIPFKQMINTYSQRPIYTCQIDPTVTNQNITAKINL